MTIAFVVEDDAISRALIARALSAISGLTVVTASSVAETKVLYEELRPDLLVLDLILKDGLGFEVLDLLDARGGVPKAIIVSSFLEEYRDRLPTGGRIQCLEKPIDVERLRHLARGHLLSSGSSPDSASDHHVSPFAPAEYVQLAGMGGHSVTLECRSYPDSERLGSIQIENGRIRSAFAGSHSGRRAFHYLITHPASRAVVAATAENEAPANVDQDWQRALLDTLRMEDEIKAGRLSSIPGDDISSLLPNPESGAPRAMESAPNTMRAATASDPAPHAPQNLTQLVDEAVRAVIRRDYDTAINWLEKAHSMAPDNRQVIHRLERLYAAQSEAKNAEGKS